MRFPALLILVASFFPSPVIAGETSSHANQATSREIGHGYTFPLTLPYITIPEEEDEGAPPPPPIDVCEFCG